jgi:hypothetical protein
MTADPSEWGTDAFIQKFGVLLFGILGSYNQKKNLPLEQWDGPSLELYLTMRDWLLTSKYFNENYTQLNELRSEKYRPAFSCDFCHSYLRSKHISELRLCFRCMGQLYCCEDCEKKAKTAHYFACSMHSSWLNHWCEPDVDALEARSSGLVVVQAVTAYLHESWAVQIAAKAIEENKVASAILNEKPISEAEAELVRREIAANRADEAIRATILAAEENREQHRSLQEGIEETKARAIELMHAALPKELLDVRATAQALYDTWLSANKEVVVEKGNDVKAFCEKWLAKANVLIASTLDDSHPQKVWARKLVAHVGKHLEAVNKQADAAPVNPNDDPNHPKSKDVDMEA